MVIMFKTNIKTLSISFTSNSSHPSQKLTAAAWQATLHHQVQDQMASGQFLPYGHQAAELGE